MKKLKAALILDNMKVAEWQRLALEEASDLLDIKLVLNCKNTKIKKSLRKNFLYYSMNFFTLRNSLTKSSEYNLSDEEVLDFNSVYNNNWQSIPKTISEHLSNEGFDVIIKFGMSLLRVDESLSVLPVLSFHHGDPSKFRGRPAGFYELLFNEEKSGLIVQKLNNELDAGEILAFAESKLVHYSYKKSAEQFYKQSQFLLRKALVNLNMNSSISMGKDGNNYRLPSNFSVIQFLLILSTRRIKHLTYGAFIEKKWRVGTFAFKPNLRCENIIDSSSINELAIEPEYTFYADPLFSSDGSKIRLEALSKKSGLGDILEIDLDSLNRPKLLLTGDHYSYPFSFLLNEVEQILPEVGSHSPQYFYSLENNEKKKVFLKGLENKRLADSTLIHYNKSWYLFFGEVKFANSVLNLWTSDTITGEFKEHPKSPICISPSSARMAGPILLTKNGLFRFGQNNNRSYGSSITISEITTLSPNMYDEEVCGSIKMNDCLGPHTIDFQKDTGMALIDYYTDNFSLFAGVRRLKALLSNNW